MYLSSKLVTRYAVTMRTPLQCASKPASNSLEATPSMQGNCQRTDTSKEALQQQYVLQSKQQQSQGQAHCSRRSPRQQQARGLQSTTPAAHTKSQGGIPSIQEDADVLQLGVKATAAPAIDHLTSHSHSNGAQLQQGERTTICNKRGFWKRLNEACQSLEAFGVLASSEGCRNTQVAHLNSNTSDRWEMALIRASIAARKLQVHTTSVSVIPSCELLYRPLEEWTVSPYLAFTWESARIL